MRTDKLVNFISILGSNRHHFHIFFLRLSILDEVLISHLLEITKGRKILKIKPTSIKSP